MNTTPSPSASVSASAPYNFLFSSCPASRALSLTATATLFPSHSSPPSSVSLTTSFSFLQNPNFITGNSLFHSMQCPLRKGRRKKREKEDNETRFCSGSSMSRNKAMVESLQRYGVIRSNKVAEVMESIDRALFVPNGAGAYIDSPMSIGYNATISAPHMHAMCLQLLEKNLQPGMHALDIGSGTGYLTACFGMMVRPEGRAVGVEHIPELVSSSIENIQKSAAAQLLKDGSLSVHAADGRKGWPEFAPYDAIHVGAAAPEIPQALIDQLKPGGRMVIPVGNMFQDLKVVDKKSDGSISVHTETSVRYVPLTSREAQLRGY
ncbi:protein-L-isoaspartate O-methyltransferase 1 isoform X1 [Arachis hypogaea]|uniref:protein-L-isoaspartate O-methyltransferase 1 isoform X1 n=1 Tax=Arachis hypogaea TaxID=3818 RepID=UPI000DEC22EA|nr:protein-L-isoaspartate O-methyltransferase 1 isoform X1 [Arachis hypogaea]